MTTNADWVKRDLDVLWHPCTQMKDHEHLPLKPIKYGKGVWLHDYDGNRYIDAVSSWWVNILGHSNPEINKALSDQAGALEHVIMAGCTHAPLIELSELLVELTPDGLDKCFYADNGSSAIEVALKMSFHFWLNTLGHSKKRLFLNLSNSYHGETLAALAVGDVGLYKETYEPLLMEPITVPTPDLFNCPEGEDPIAYTDRIFEETEKALAEHHESLAAVIIEPLLQCAGSMRMYHPHFIKRLREACDRYNVHLIADEIATGFGRTGSWFGCNQADVSPDFMCVSKALTGGYLPMAVVLTGQNVYDAFYDEYETMRAFLHSHSYTGNPLAAAVALKTLEILKRDRFIEERNVQTAAYMRKSVEHLQDHPHIGDIRQHGMVLAMEMVKDKASKTPFPWQERRGIRVYKHGLENECLLRPLGNVVYFMPPYVINEDEIDHLAKIATEGINLATRD